MRPDDLVEHRHVDFPAVGCANITTSSNVDVDVDVDKTHIEVAVGSIHVPSMDGWTSSTLDVLQGNLDGRLDLIYIYV